MARRQRISVRRITLLLAVLIFLLAGLLAIEVWLLTHKDRQNADYVDLSSRFLIPKITIPPVPPIASFDEITRRNLFAADRGRSPSEANPAPSDAQAEPSPSSPSSSQMKLIAVIMAPGTQLAILEPASGEVARKVPIGEAVNGWRLTAIYSDHVELENSGATEELYLSDSIPPQDTSGSKNGNRQMPDAVQ